MTACDDNGRAAPARRRLSGVEQYAGGLRRFGAGGGGVWVGGGGVAVRHGGCGVRSGRRAPGAGSGRAGAGPRERQGGCRAKGRDPASGTGPGTGCRAETASRTSAAGGQAHRTAPHRTDEAAGMRARGSRRGQYGASGRTSRHGQAPCPGTYGRVAREADRARRRPRGGVRGPAPSRGRATGSGACVRLRGRRGSGTVASGQVTGSGRGYSGAVALRASQSSMRTSGSSRERPRISSTRRMR